MMALLQRVRHARVEVAGETRGRDRCRVCWCCCAPSVVTPKSQSDKLLAKILKLRIFSDAAGKMNHSVQDMDGVGTAGGLLVVSQFTLAADTSGGNRPSFTAAAAPDDGRRLYDYFVAQARRLHPVVQTGVVCSGHAGESGERRAGDDSAAGRTLEHLRRDNRIPCLWSLNAPPCCAACRPGFPGLTARWRLPCSCWPAQVC